MLKVRKEFKEFLKGFFVLVYILVFICCCMISIGGLFLSTVHLHGVKDLFEQLGIGYIVSLMLVFCYVAGVVFITVSKNIFDFIFERENNNG